MIRIIVISLIMFCMCASADASLIVLYDASQGSTPDQQEMLYFGDTETVITSDTSSTRVDTTADRLLYGGYNYWSSEEMSRVTGYKVIIAFEVFSEGRTNDDRSGVRIRLESDDDYGVRLDFWENEIWEVQADSTHLDKVDYNTKQMTVYELEVLNDSYTLSANDTIVKTGALYLYNAGTPQGNYLQFGDSTGQAYADFALSYVAVDIYAEPIPEPATIALLGISLISLSRIRKKLH